MGMARAYTPGGAEEMKGTLITVAIALLLVGPLAKAAEHPVPIEKDTDCTTCHEDKSKGKHVHSAIAMGCTTCHEVRVNRGVTRVKLITTTPTALCLQCHSDKNAAEIKGHVHPPAVRGCTTCHDPHTSDNPNQLLKPTSGGKGENLCLQCHTKGLNVPEKGSRHAALDMGCDTCHTVHKVGDPAQREFKYHLAKATPALCLDCHDGKDANLQKAHHGQPFANADCITCHDPHDSSGPHLVQKFAHPPFADQMCDTCHQPAKDGKVVLTEKDTRTLCLTCHEDKGKEIESAKVQHPGAQGECTDCHDPHAGRTPGFLHPDPVTACTNCHTDIGELHSKKVLHQPAFEQGCATCHEPHGGDNEHLLRAANVDSLCLECHGSKAPAPAGDHMVSIFGGKVKLPDDYFAKNSVVRLDIKYGRGHPVADHPVEDIRDPQDPSKIRKPMNCLTCHQPHAGGARAMLVNDTPPTMKFCGTCHKGTIEGGGQ